MKILILVLLLFAVVGCNSSDSNSASSSHASKSVDSEAPCDDEAPKIEVSEAGINLLEEDEGCKLEE